MNSTSISIARDLWKTREIGWKKLPANEASIGF